LIKAPETTIRNLSIENRNVSTTCWPKSNIENIVTGRPANFSQTTPLESQLKDDQETSVSCFYHPSLLSLEEISIMPGLYHQCHPSNIARSGKTAVCGTIPAAAAESGCFLDAI
jgi:hypothetical protein